MVRRVASPSHLFAVGKHRKARVQLRPREPRPADPTAAVVPAAPVPAPRMSDEDLPIAARLRSRRPAGVVEEPRAVPSMALRSRRLSPPDGPPDAGPGPSSSGAPPGVGPSGDSDPGRDIFQCPECPRSFTTASGLGLHRRRAHLEAFDRGINVERVRRGWSQEEVLLMVREEAAATIRGVRFLNQHLASIVPNRSIDAIKGVRRRPDYKEAVEEYLRSLRDPASSSASSADDEYHSAEEESTTTSAPSRTGPSLSPSVGRPSLSGSPAPGQMVRRLVEVVDQIVGWNSVQLARLARDAIAGGSDVTAGVSLWLENTFFPATFDRAPRFVRVKIVKTGRKLGRRQEYARVPAAYP